MELAKSWNANQISSLDLGLFLGTLITFFFSVKFNSYPSLALMSSIGYFTVLFWIYPSRALNKNSLMVGYGSSALVVGFATVYLKAGLENACWFTLGIILVLGLALFVKVLEETFGAYPEPPQVSTDKAEVIDTLTAIEIILSFAVSAFLGGIYWLVEWSGGEIAAERYYTLITYLFILWGIVRFLIVFWTGRHLLFLVFVVMPGPFVVISSLGSPAGTYDMAALAFPATLIGFLFFPLLMVVLFIVALLVVGLVWYCLTPFRLARQFYRAISGWFAQAP